MLKEMNINEMENLNGGDINVDINIDINLDVNKLIDQIKGDSHNNKHSNKNSSDLYGGCDDSYTLHNGHL